MGWETRGNNRYYYRKRRQADGTVVSEYVGYGLIGDLYHSKDGIERHERTVARLALQDLQTANRRIEQVIEAYRRPAREAIHTALRACGFHQHKGQWRLKRGETSTVADEIVKATGTELAEYYELRKAADGKKPGPALARLREYIQNHPSLFDGQSVFANTTIQEVINCCTPSETNRIHLRGEVDALRRSLGATTATPLERILIDDVALCWLRMQIFEQLYSANYDKSGGVTLTKAAYLERRLSATRRRYLQSIEALARVRGLLSRIGVQVNIAQQQIVNG